MLRIKKGYGIDGIIAKMLKCEMLSICYIAWEHSKVPEKWRRHLFTFNEGKGSGDDSIRKLI